MIWAALVGLTLASPLLTGLGCDSSREVDTGWSEPEEIPDQEISDGFVLAETDKGIKKWVLTARTAKIFDSQNLILADSLEVDFYRDGEQFSRLEALRGKIDQNTRNMEAEGDVVVTSREGFRLETEKLRWDNTAERILSDEFVTVTKGRDVLTGTGMEADASLEEVEIKRDVRAYIVSEDGSLIEID